MNLKDKAFLEKFCLKESSILIGLKDFGATVSHCGLVGEVVPPSLPINQQMTKSPPIRVLPAKFSYHAHKSLTLPIFT